MKLETTLLDLYNLIHLQLSENCSILPYLTDFGKEVKLPLSVTRPSPSQHDSQLVMKYSQKKIDEIIFETSQCHFALRFIDIIH